MKKTSILAAIALMSLVGIGATLVTVIDDYEPPQIVKPVRENPTVTLIGSQKKREKGNVRGISHAKQSKRDGDVQTIKTAFNQIPFSTEVFEEDDVLGFNAIRELQRNSADKEMVKKAIIASGHKRGGIPLEQTLMVFTDGTRMEVTIPVVDGCLDNNTVVVLENGAVTNNFGETYVGDLVAIYGGTNITSLGKDIFLNSKTLVEAVFPSVTNIGIQAFALCDNLALVSCPLAETVGCQSFLYDSNLRAIDMPNLVKVEELTVEEGQENNHTGNNFFGCTSLEFLSLPSLETIDGQSSFFGCTSLKEAYLPKLRNMPIGTLEDSPLERVDFQSLASYEVDDYAWEETEEKDGQTVVKTNHYYYVPFMNAKMHKLELPSLTEVPDYGFWNLQNFRELDFPSAKNVGKEAFRYCFELTDVKLPSATNIADKAFVYCYNLRRMFLPNVETLGIEVFHLAGFREIELTKLGKLEFGTFLQCPQLKTPILPALTNAASQADAVNNRNDGFAYTGLEEINLTEVKVVGSNMFEGSDKLRTVWLPSAERIGRRAFALCKSLEELYLCDGTNGVQDVIIPETAADMELGLFSGVPGTVNVIVPDRLYGAWKTNAVWTALNVNIYSWSNYKPVRIREFSPEVVDMGTTTNLVFSMKENRTFTVREDCNNPVFTIELNDVHKVSTSEVRIDNIMVNVVSGEATVIVTRPGITTLTPRRADWGEGINYNRFLVVTLDNNNPLSINGPATVRFQYKTTGSTFTYVSGQGTGTYSANLNIVPYVLITRQNMVYETPDWPAQAKITFQDGKTRDYEFGGVVTKENTKYAGLQKSTDGEWNEPGITRVSLGEAVTGLDNGAFYRCLTLNEILLPNTVNNIGNDVFRDCSSLTNVVLSSSSAVTNIGEYAFYGCQMKKFVIPENTKSLGTFAFGNCSAMEELVIPNSVVELERNTFQGCFAKKVTLPQKLCGDYNADIISSIHDCWDLYQSVTNVVVADGVTSLGGYSLMQCPNLKSVTIPASVETFGAACLGWNSNLTDLYLPGRSTNDVQTLKTDKGFPFGLSSGRTVHFDDGNITTE